MEELRYESKSSLNIEMTEIQQDKKPSAEFETARKQKKSSITQNLLKSFNDFSLKEARERKTTPIEKFVWLLMFLSCFTYCGILIWKSYWKWMKSPSIVMLTENDEPIRQIPFPAVTLCPESKIISSVFNYDDYMLKKTKGNLTEEEQNNSNNMFDALSLICNYNSVPVKRKDFLYANETVSNIRKASTGLSQVISMCSWKGRRRNCTSMFSPILTEEGICFTFNTIGPEDLFQHENVNRDYEYMESLNRTRNQGWSLDYGYPDDAPRRTYPVRGSGAGPKAGLEIKLTEMEAGLDWNCKRRLSGFKILLHSPSDLPRPSQQYIRIPTYQEVTIAFTATLEFTSDGLEVFTPFGRQCYFDSERSLKYFKMYTLSNCEYECLTNFTYARCGCVHFSMPHSPDMAICNAERLKCMSKAEMELSTMDIEDEGMGNVTYEEAIRIADSCLCLPSCTSITYETEVIVTELHEMERHAYDFKNISRGGRIIKSKVSRVLLFFKRALFDVAKRSELYGTSDILASCGGLLGLFMGFSVISIVEILYFCILRVCRRHRADEFEDSNNQTVQQSTEKY